MKGNRASFEFPLLFGRSSKFQSQHIVPAIIAGAHQFWLSSLARMVEWRQRARSRRELMRLNDFELNDIGIGRSFAQVEGRKPFWRE
jgi:uncharacterized protein YjiS (DUF1127 family)